MILMIFNHQFPDSSGFAKRCENVISMLQKKDSVTVLCRQNDYRAKEVSIYKTSLGSIPLIHFTVHTKAVERTDTIRYMSGIYELVRNVDLFMSFSFQLFRYLFANAFKTKISIYCVNSPLTVPLFTYVITRFFPVDLHVLEFHDLEPEMAKHIKQLPENSLVMKVEYFLERFLSKRFRKIVVTSESQKQRLLERTGVSKSSMFVLPNIAGAPGHYQAEEMRKKYGVSTTNFVLAYNSNLSYDYTVSGVVELLNNFATIIKVIPNILFIIAGDGDGLALLKKSVKQNKLEKHVLFTGRIADVYEVVSIADVALIPWHKSVLSEVILPTKLLEYMAMGKAIVAPNFGEFKHVLKENETGLLYSDVNDLSLQIMKLYRSKESREKLGLAAKKQYLSMYNNEKISHTFNTFLNSK